MSRPDLSRARTNMLLSRRLCSVKLYGAQNGEENTHSSIIYNIQV